MMVCLLRSCNIYELAYNFHAYNCSLKIVCIEFICILGFPKMLRQSLQQIRQAHLKTFSPVPYRSKVPFQVQAMSWFPFQLRSCNLRPLLNNGDLKKWLCWCWRTWQIWMSLVVQTFFNICMFSKHSTILLAPPPAEPSRRKVVFSKYFEHRPPFSTYLGKCPSIVLKSSILIVQITII